MMTARYLNLFWLIAMTVAVALGSGCSSPAKSSAMVPKEFQIARRHAASISLGVTGGKETNPLWKSDISSQDFEKAVGDAIRSSGVFSAVVGRDGCEYKLEVTLVKVMSPNMGFAMKSTVVTEWRLSDVKGGGALLEEFIATSYTAEVGEAFAAVKRLRLSIEGAARANIQEGLKRLSEMELPNRSGDT